MHALCPDRFCICSYSAPPKGLHLAASCRITVVWHYSRGSSLIWICRVVYSSRFSDLGCLVNSETLGVQKMVLEEETQSQRVGTCYPFFHGLSKKSKWSGFKQDPENKLNLCPVLKELRAPYPANTTREPLLRGSQACLLPCMRPIHLSLIPVSCYVPFNSLLCMCFFVILILRRILHRFVHSFSFNERVHLFTGRTLTFTSMMCWA